jgi:hypothetical protein
MTASAAIAAAASGNQQIEEDKGKKITARIRLIGCQL